MLGLLIFFLHCNCNIHLVNGKLVERSEGKKRRRWGPAESKVVLDAFHRHIVNGALPGKKECDKLIKDYPVILRHRSPEMIRQHVRTHIKNLKKKVV